MPRDEKAQTSCNARWVVLAQGAILLSTLVSLAAFWSSGYDWEALTWLLCAFFTFHFAWGLWSWHAATGRWIDAHSLFFVSLCLFNGGHAMLKTFGLGEGCALFDSFSPTTICQTLLVVNAAAVAFHFGGLLICVRDGRASDPPGRLAKRPSATAFDLTRVRLLGMVFLLVGAPTMMCTAITSLRQVVAGGYMSLYQQELQIGLGNWQAVLAQFFVPGVLLVFAASRGSPGRIWMCWGLMAAFVLIGLVLGTRAAAAEGALAMLMLHDGIVRKVPRTCIFAVCLAGCYLMPLIGAVRTQQIDDRYGAMMQGLEDNSLVLLVREMGGSATTIAYTITLVPAARNYDYGEGYCYAFLTSVPNLFWDRHPSAMRGTYSDWLIWTVDPTIAEMGGGIGYSVVAEAYANFSQFGVPVVLAFLGAALGGFASWARKGVDPFKRAMETILLTTILFLPRSESAGTVRGIIWLCAIPCLIVGVSKTKGQADYVFELLNSERRR